MIDSGFAIAMVIAGTLAGLAAGYLFHEVVVAGYSSAVDSLTRERLLELAERRRPGRLTDEPTYHEKAIASVYEVGG